nr:hypothetical protein [uncultured Capnocytophaga sp.]
MYIPRGELSLKLPKGTNRKGGRAARAEMGAMGVMGGWGGSGENSPRLTYSAIADNPKGGQAGKWRLRVGGLRIKNNFY